VSAPEVVIHRDADQLAAATAARLITKLVDLQASGQVPRIVLTGGGSGIGLLAQVNSSPARDVVDWSRVEVFWGDERFVPVDDDERNEKPECTRWQPPMASSATMSMRRPRPMPRSSVSTHISTW
jgi:6-phosphogluconolactonase